VDQVCIYTGDVLGGEGATLADALVTVRLVDRRDLEVGDTSRVDSFVTLPPGTR
jgi:hypothetical protein